jgi:hypothetical protein
MEPRRARHKETLVACATLNPSFNDYPTLSICHPESPRANASESERVRELLRCRFNIRHTFYDSVVLSEAPRVRFDYPRILARSRSIPRMLTA